MTTKKRYLPVAEERSIMQAVMAKHSELSFLEKRKLAYMKIIQTIAKRRGGECLDEKYVKQVQRMTFRCKNGHVFKTMAIHVLQGRWCSRCSYDTALDRHRPRQLVKLKKYLEEKGGSLVSPDSAYMGTTAPLEFRCQDGHTWTATPSSILRGAWCTHCPRQRASRKEGKRRLMAKLKKRKMELVSPEFTILKVKYKFRCSHGHVFETTANSIVMGTGCPVCFKSRVKQRLMDILAKKNWTFIGPADYVRMKDKCTVRCSRGHVFETTGETIERGGGCPTCFKEKIAELR